MPSFKLRTLCVAVCITFCALTCSAETTESLSASERIISLNGSNTEVLFALGVGSQVVGRDDSAIYPPEVNRIPSVGYQYKLNAEGVLALHPTLVIGRSDAKPATVLEQIRATGVRLALIDEPENFEQAGQRIKQLGSLVHKDAKAAELVSQLQADVKAFEERKAELGEATKKRVAFLYFRGPKTMFVLGNDTAPGQMIQLVGAENVFADVGFTAPLTAEALIAAKPDVIVTFTHGVESIGGIAGLQKLPGVSLTPAGKNNRFVVMDDLYLGGFTNRAGKAALDLLNAIQQQGVVEVTGR